MAFLSVLCVVLYLRNGVSMPNEFIRPTEVILNPHGLPSKSLDTEYSVQNPANTKFSHTSLPNIESGDNLQEEGIAKNIKSGKIRPESQSDIFKGINTIRAKQYTLQPQNRNEYNEPNVNNIKLPRDEMNLISFNQPELTTKSLQSTYQNERNINDVTPKYQNQQRKTLFELPLNPEEDTKFELQGIPLEYLKSLISISRENPPKQQLSPVSLLANSRLDKDGAEHLKHFDPNVNYGSQQSYKASFQNPSAENLYKLNQAAPYKISNQQSTDLSQDNPTLQHILSKAKRLQDVHPSAKQGKYGMIIHPDGTVEQIDDLDSATVKYPNYITISSTDLTKLTEGDRANFIPTSTTSEENSSEASPVITKSETTFIEKNVDEEVLNGTPNNTLLSNDIIKSSSEISTISGDSYEKGDSTKSVLAQVDKPAGNDVNCTINIPLKNSPIISTTLPETSLKENASNKKNLTANLLVDNENVNRDERKTSNVISNPTLLEDEDGSITYPIDSPLSNDDNTDYSKFWFVTNEEFWENLQKDTQSSVYFLLVPPAPKEKETKIIIYPNGTTVEEVLETVDDEYGDPVKTKTTKITLK